MILFKFTPRWTSWGLYHFKDSKIFSFNKYSVSAKDEGGNPVKLPDEQKKKLKQKKQVRKYQA
jgi:hypothetical protein